jgi:hypothetical protein
MAEFPAGQWDYQMFYRENFEQARSVFEANVAATMKALFRKGDPAAKPTAVPTDECRARWFSLAGRRRPISRSTWTC